MQVKLRRRFGLGVVIALVLSVLVAIPMAANQAQAANASDFNPGMLISDAQFYDGRSMTEAQVQSFLNEKGKNCTSNCLKDHKTSTYNIGATARCDAYKSNGVETAAAIIAKVGAACNISPKALIVLLEKETSLITMDWPANWRYERATGYYCPDDPNRPGWCDPEYAGLFNQLYNAAAQFNRYKQNAGDYAYQAGRNNSIAYHPNSFGGSCGFQNVYIENQATAGLYIYTPYVPNKSALNNLYGSGDSCAAYGNRNFWRLYTDWFGNAVASAPAGVNPVANLEELRIGEGGVVLSGWAADGDDPKVALDIRITWNGGEKTISAGNDRADVGNAYPSFGSKHGFSDVLDLPAGKYDICVTAMNRGLGSDVELGCRTLTVVEGVPVGEFETAWGDFGAVQVSGWAVDPDATSASIVKITWAGGSADLVADGARTDVATQYPEKKSSVGFSGKVSLPAGTTEVCAVIQGQGVGGNTDLGCKPIHLYGENPIGAVDLVAAKGGAVRISGWALDPSLGTASSNVRITIDNDQAIVPATTIRRDLLRHHPAFGVEHGFDVVVLATPGEHKVCVFAVDNGDGRDVQLKCQTVSVPAADPDPEPTKAPVPTETATPEPTPSLPVTAKGGLDKLESATGGVEIHGWAALSGPNNQTIIEVSVDGRAPVKLHTGVLRADVASKYNVASNLGFSAIVPAPAGSSSVCVIATNTVSGDRQDFGCFDVK